MIPSTSCARVEVDTILLQPTKWCAKACKGCYVKAHKLSGSHTYWYEQVRLLKLLLAGKEAFTNQIIVSLDDLPSNLDGEKARHSLELFGFLAYLLKKAQNTQDTVPLVSLTCRSVSTLSQYIDESKLYFTDTTKLFHRLSFSEIDLHRDFYQLAAIRANKTLVNYNYTVSTNPTDKDLMHMVSVADQVDSIYLVLFKNSIGSNRIGYAKAHSFLKRRTKKFYEFRDKLKSKVEEEFLRHERPQIITDTCIQDAEKYHESGKKYGCSANIHKFQVWPDGSVSGCPYASVGNTPSAEFAEEILENIKLARASYDFDHCYIPQTIEEK